jgi:hypothetical protein
MMQRNVLISHACQRCVATQNVSAAVNGASASPSSGEGHVSCVDRRKCEGSELKRHRTAWRLQGVSRKSANEWNVYYCWDKEGTEMYFQLASRFLEMKPVNLMMVLKRSISFNSSYSRSFAITVWLWLKCSILRARRFGGRRHLISQTCVLNVQYFDRWTESKCPVALQLCHLFNFRSVY